MESKWSAPSSVREPKLALGSGLVKLIAEIDEFKGRWEALKTFSPDRLSALRKVAAIESIGSSTRIEGAKLSDANVEDLGEFRNKFNCRFLKAIPARGQSNQSDVCRSLHRAGGCPNSRLKARLNASSDS
jgi:hypothetical protein